MNPLVLTGISHRHGDWRNLADLADRGLATRSEVDALGKGGLARYSVLDAPVRALYPECVGDSLRTAGVKPSDVDAVLFFSSTFASYDDHDDLIALCRHHGMTRALPMGVFLGQCTNFSYALLVATALIRGQGMRTVLLLGADALDETRASRLLPAAASVFSDTVFSCVLGADLEHGYAVEHVGHLVEPELSALDPVKNQLKFMDLFADRLTALCRETYASTGLRPEQVDHLVLANLATPVLRNYAAVAGVPYARAATGNVARYGHCFAYDQLITLASLADDGKITPGQAALALGVGANHLFSATLLRML